MHVFSTYNNWQRVSRQPIDEELLRDVIAAIGIFKRQVKFVIAIEDVKTFISVRPRAFVVSTSAINVNLNVFS